MNEIKGETIDIAGQRRPPPAPLRRMSSGNDVFFKKTQDPFTYSHSSQGGGNQLATIPQQGFYPQQQPQQQQPPQQMQYPGGIPLNYQQRPANPATFQAPFQQNYNNNSGSGNNPFF